MAAVLLYLVALRPQDADYDAAIAQANTMITDADSFKQLSSDSSFEAATVTSDQLNQATQLASGYNDALKVLADSSAITRDNQVAKVYASVKQQVTDYGHGTADMMATLKALSSIKQDCNVMLANIRSATTVTALNTVSQDCRNAVNKNTSVPLQEFNDQYFVPYRKGVVNVIKALNTYYEAGAASDAAAQKQAQKDLDAALATVEALNAKNYAMTNASVGPKDALNKLLDVLNKQKTVFIR